MALSGTWLLLVAATCYCGLLPSRVSAFQAPTVYVISDSPSPSADHRHSSTGLHWNNRKLAQRGWLNQVLEPSDALEGQQQSAAIKGGRGRSRAPNSRRKWPANRFGQVQPPAPRRTAAQAGKNLVCYYGSWAVYRPGPGKFAVEDIDPFLCTHIIYGFTGLSFDNTIKPLDPYNDLEENYGKGALRRFTGLKRQNPALKTLVAIGGWNEGSIKYSRMAAEPGERAKFVRSVLDFLDRYQFDGLDLDWEYPGSRGGRADDKQNYVLLLRDLHEAFAPRGYLLTAAVAAGSSYMEPAYNIREVSRYLDFINLMAYDYHGGWEQRTGLNAPLYSSPKFDSSRLEQQLNVNWSVNQWLAGGAPREKLLLGLGSYGRSFTLNNGRDTGIGAPASQRGRAGPYTREPGTLGYNELCEFLQRAPASWTMVRDPDYLAPYAYNAGERQWVGYDDPQSIALKAAYARQLGLGGLMMWSLETDDFRGGCHAGQRYPLLSAAKRELTGAGPPVTTTTSTTTTREPHEVEGPPSSTRRPTVGPSSRPTTSTGAPSSRPTTSTGAPIRTTTSTTSTSAPPEISGEFRCREAGMFADPSNCRRFLRCVELGAERYSMFRFDCAPGTAYDAQHQYCDYTYNVPRCRQQLG